MNFTMMASDMLLFNTPHHFPTLLSKRLPAILPGVLSLRMSSVSASQDAFVDLFCWKRDSFAWSNQLVLDLDADSNIKEVVRTRTYTRTDHQTGILQINVPVMQQRDKVQSVVFFELSSADGEGWCAPLSRLIWAYLRAMGVNSISFGSGL